MAHHEEHSRVDLDRIEIRIVLSAFPPDQLLDEGHVRVCAGTSILHSLVSLWVRDALSVNHVRTTDGRRAGNTLHAVHIALSALASHIAEELDCVVEDTGNILFVMISQVIGLVHDALVLVIILTVVSSAVDHMRDAEVLKDFSVFSDQVTSKVEVVIDDLGADSLVELIFVLFARRATVVEVFIIQHFWSDHGILSELSYVQTHIAVAFSLALAAGCAELLIGVVTIVAASTARAHVVIWCHVSRNPAQIGAIV